MRQRRLGRTDAIRWSEPLAGLLLVSLLAAPAAAPARDEGADGKFDKRTSSHFVLYQDVDIDESGGLRGSRRFEQQVLDELEGAYDQLDAYLALRPRRKVDVLVYDSGIFDAQFARRFRFQAAGFYNHVIRIRGGTVLDGNLAVVLHHELVHAAYDAEAPSLVLPAWYNEGVAEWFADRAALGKRHLTRGELGALQRARAQGVLFSFAELSTPSFVHMGQGGASLAYLQSYAFIEFLARRYGEDSVRELSAELVRTRDLHRTLQRVFRSDLSGLERAFVADLG